MTTHDDDGRRRDGRIFALESPHFLKIILSDSLHSGKLGIPQGFLRRYASNLSVSKLALLQVPGRSTWQVELEQREGRFWFCNGWQEFADHHSLGYGYLLVFRYQGDSTFHVIIFDKSACEIDYPLRQDRVKQSKCRASTLPQVCPDHNLPVPPPPPEVAGEFKSKHPFFKLVIWPSCAKKGGASIPRGFLKRHIPNNAKMVTTLRHADRWWQVTLKRCLHAGLGVFSAGWPKFAREMQLVKGDVCLFELVDPKDFVFRVSIFRRDVEKLDSA